MKLSPIERRMAQALIAGPRTVAELQRLTSSEDGNTARVWVGRLRRKLPAGSGVVAETRYVLTGEARAVLSAALATEEAA